MAPRTIYLVSFRPSKTQRAHFGIWVPSVAKLEIGTLIHVVGAPMAGFSLQFKRSYNLELTKQEYELWPIGEVDSTHFVERSNETFTTDTNPRGDLEIAATQVRPPGISQNFMAPVNDTTNKRCQEWTMEYVRHLVAKGYIGAQAIQIVQSKRDPPSFGIGLRPVAR